MALPERRQPQTKQSSWGLRKRARRSQGLRSRGTAAPPKPEGRAGGMESRQERAEDSRGPGSQPPLQRTSRMSTKAWTYRSQQRMAGPSGAFPVPLRPGPSSFRGKEGTALTEWLSTQSPSTQAHPTLPASHNPGDPGSCWWVFPLQSSLHELAILIFPKHLAHSHTHTRTHTLCLQTLQQWPWAPSVPSGPERSTHSHCHTWSSDVLVQRPCLRPTEEKTQAQGEEALPQGPPQLLGGTASPTSEPGGDTGLCVSS